MPSIKTSPASDYRLSARGVLLLVALVVPIRGTAQPTPAAQNGSQADSADTLPSPDRRVLYHTAKDRQGEPVELHLDMFLPPNWQAGDRRPAVVFFFGGGWKSGSPAQFYPFCHELAQRGMVCASAEYRVKSRHGTAPQACVDDGRAAVAYLRAHAAEWGIDAERIAAGGGSAGGHVAAATGILPGGAAGSAADALLLFNPVIDTSSNGYGKEAIGKQWKELSPLHHVHSKQPPTLICHGTADTTTPLQGVQDFRDAMLAANNQCTLILFAGRNHGFFNSPAFQPQRDGADYRACLQASVDFLLELGWIL